MSTPDVCGFKSVRKSHRPKNILTFFVDVNKLVFNQFTKNTPATGPDLDTCNKARIAVDERLITIALPRRDSHGGFVACGNNEKGGGKPVRTSLACPCLQGGNHPVQN